MAEDETPVTEENIDVTTPDDELTEPEPAPIGEHGHPELRAEVERLDARCAELERQLTELRGQIKSNREGRPEDDHWYFHKIGDRK